MTRRPVLDVSELPLYAFGAREPLWWGVVGLVAIESMVFALAVVTYYYLRGGAVEWPPPGVTMPLGVGTANLIAMLVSNLPMHRVNQAALKGALRPMRNWLLAGCAVSLICLVLRAYELSGMSFRYNSHAYGSIVWMIFGLHTLHLLTSNAENLVFLALLFKGPVEKKHLGDLRLNGLYWYFVTLSWIPLYAVLYWDAGLFRR